MSHDAEILSWVMLTTILSTISDLIIYAISIKLTFSIYSHLYACVFSSSFFFVVAQELNFESSRKYVKSLVTLFAVKISLKYIIAEA